MRYIQATGAYGRVANLKDWEAGKDFRDAETGQYFSIRDLDYLRQNLYVGVMFYVAGKYAFKIDVYPENDADEYQGWGFNQG